jgi:hypothetical protein
MLRLRVQRWAELLQGLEEFGWDLDSRGAGEGWGGIAFAVVGMVLAKVEGAALGRVIARGKGAGVGFAG